MGLHDHYSLNWCRHHTILDQFKKRLQIYVTYKQKSHYKPEEPLWIPVRKTVTETGGIGVCPVRITLIILVV